MRLDDESESSNYERRRGGGGFGLPMGIPLGRGGLGCGSLIVILIISMVLGVNPLSLLGDSQQGAPVTERSEPGEAPGGKTPVMVRSLKVLGSTERVWSTLAPTLASSSISSYVTLSSLRARGTILGSVV